MARSLRRLEPTRLFPLSHLPRGGAGRALARRIQAVLLQACLLATWFVAPTVDAWSYHRAASASTRTADEQIAAPNGGHPVSCAIVLAATVPPGCAAVPAVTVRPSRIVRVEPRSETTPALPQIAHVLPLSRAPPRSALSA